MVRRLVEQDGGPDGARTVLLVVRLCACPVVLVLLVQCFEAHLDQLLHHRRSEAVWKGDLLSRKQPESGADVPALFECHRRKEQLESGLELEMKRDTKVCLFLHSRFPSPPLSSCQNHHSNPDLRSSVDGVSCSDLSLGTASRPRLAMRERVRRWRSG